MDELIQIPKQQLDHIQERARRLALEKSYLQLVNSLMNSLSAVPGLENTIDAILKLILNNIGGTNVCLYYMIGSEIHYADVYGTRKQLDDFGDTMVSAAFQSREFQEETGTFNETQMMTPEFTKASDWALPLMVKERAVAVLKMEGMLMGAAEVRSQLQPFFAYAALVLKNEIESYEKLEEINLQLKQVNEELLGSRNRLKLINLELEGRVRERTADLLATNERLKNELAERLRAEQALRRFNRALKTLSSGNEALVRAKNEKDLLERMCNTLVEQGGYRATWIGLISDDRPQWIQPAAWAGPQSGSLSKQNGSFSWADQSDSVSLALQTGEAKITRTPALLPADTGETGVSARVVSSIAFALKKESGLLGALAIFSDDEEAFDSEEVKLLKELSEDLAYGILTLRMHEDHERGLKRLQSSMEATVQALADTVELRDPYTAGHQRRVAKLAQAIAKEMGLPDDRIRGIYLAGVVHDVGKIYVPAEVLSRPGRLSFVEIQLVQTHVDAGYEILRPIDFPWPIADIVHQHHERMDGSGYPRGLTGNSILLDARILAVADVVEAISSHRPYRAAVGIEPALNEIENGRGSLFDEQVVDACTRLFRQSGYAFD